MLKKLLLKMCVRPIEDVTVAQIPLENGIDNVIDHEVDPGAGLIDIQRDPVAVPATDPATVQETDPVAALVEDLRRDLVVLPG